MNTPDITAFLQALKELGVGSFSVTFNPSININAIQADDKKEHVVTFKPDVVNDVVKDVVNDVVKDVVKEKVEQTQPVVKPSVVEPKPKQEKVVITPPPPPPKQENAPVDCSFESFAIVVENDDGGEENAVLRKRILADMSLDDLLRVNNEFGLGVDTDKPIDDVRTDISNCF